MYPRIKRVLALVFFIICAALTVPHLFAAEAGTKRYTVLSVMSYGETFPWYSEIRDGMAQALSGRADIHYFYMDTKKNYAGGVEKAAEAYRLYQELRPDGVLTADDNAQSMFVVPYLKDKEKTPVIFCGVNADPQKYGYPATNVSGILERSHIRESIAFAKLLVPDIQTVGYIFRESPTGRALVEEIQEESAAYAAKSVAYKLPRTIAEAVAMTEALKGQCDLLVMTALPGITDEKGESMEEKDVVARLAPIFGKATVGTHPFHVEAGALCSVVVSGREHGKTSATMLLEAMNGKPVAQLPVVKNENGKRIINVTVLRYLGIRPEPVALRGAQLVKTEQ